MRIIHIIGILGELREVTKDLDDDSKLYIYDGDNNWDPELEIEIKKDKKSVNICYCRGYGKNA